MHSGDPHGALLHPRRPHQSTLRDTGPKRRYAVCWPRVMQVGLIADADIPIQTSTSIQSLIGCPGRRRFGVMLRAP